jgi:hypothetical protein
MSKSTVRFCIVSPAFVYYFVYNKYILTRLPVNTLTAVILNPEISELISKLDSGSRKGNTCCSTAKFIGDYNYLSYSRFRIKCGMTSVGFKEIFLTGKRVILVCINIIHIGAIKINQKQYE